LVVEANVSVGHSDVDMPKRSGRSRGCCSSEKAERFEAGVCGLDVGKKEGREEIGMGRGRLCSKQMREMKDVVGMQVF
jgi:hypothetical protein